MSKPPKHYISDIPELIAEWNWEKNNELGLYPNMIAYGSGKKVWWKCKRGHEWQTTIHARFYNKCGCPYCAGHRAIKGETDLQTVNPSLAKEWNYDKNKELTPADIMPGSTKKVWWKCEKGHEWQASVGSRHCHNNSCPYCTNQKVLKGYNDLATIYPEIAQQWHPTKNGDLLPTDVTAHTVKSVWWLCEHGHEWKASISNRTHNRFPTGCPHCSNAGKSRAEIAILYYLQQYTNEKVIYRYNALGFEIDIFIESLNIGIEYDGYYYHSDKTDKELLKNRQCLEHGITLYRIRELPLPSLNSSSIDLFYQFTKNYQDFSSILATLFESIFQQSFDIDVLRDILNIIQYMSTINRNKSLGCKYPHLITQWHPIKNENLTPFHVTCGSNMKVWWRCLECGHEWQAVIASRTKGHGCPKCARQRIAKNLKIQ